jgi:hypothetical protein
MPNLINYSNSPTTSSILLFSFNSLLFLISAFLRSFTIVNIRQQVIKIRASSKAISFSNLVLAFDFLRAFFSSSVSAI